MQAEPRDVRLRRRDCGTHDPGAGPGMAHRLAGGVHSRGDSEHIDQAMDMTNYSNPQSTEEETRWSPGAGLETGFPLDPLLNAGERPDRSC